VTVTTEGGSDALCYKLSVLTDRGTYELPSAGRGTAALSDGRAAYSADTLIYFYGKRPAPSQPSKPSTSPSATIFSQAAGADVFGWSVALCGSVQSRLCCVPSSGAWGASLAGMPGEHVDTATDCDDAAERSVAGCLQIKRLRL